MTAESALEMRCAARTDVGLERERNEDAFAVVPDDLVFVVADGMGGHAAGEVASRLAVETIVEIFAHTRDEDATWPDDRLPGCSLAESRLVCAVRAANARVIEAARSDVGRAGMGTTVVAAHASGGVLYIAHVGDSRAYVVRDGMISQLTRDHSLYEDMRAGRPDIPPELKRLFPRRHVITRALGIAERVDVDVVVEPLRDGDVFLLCTDGLSGMVEGEAMLEIIGQSGGDLEAAAAWLIDAANLAGGTDNITVVLVAAEIAE